jgi:tetratricopeptide (TPR) repeat protein
MRSLGAWTLPLTVLLAGCDAGKAPYQEAVTLEEQGKLAEAVARYDSVCRRAPDSSLCPPSVVGAARVRGSLADHALDAANALVTGLRFMEADAALRALANDASTPEAEKAKATAALAAPVLALGVRYEKALALPDKAAALPEMEAVAVSASPAAPKATEWLTRERPPLLLAVATKACQATPPAECADACQHLLTLHPAAAEAAQARTLLETWKTQEDARVRPLLAQGEQLLAQCQSLWRHQKTHQDCIMGQLAGSDDPFVALAACGDADALTRRQEKLKETWTSLLENVGAESQASADLDARWSPACDHGEYEPKKSAKATAASAPSSKIAAAKPAMTADTCRKGCDPECAKSTDELCWRHCVEGCSSQYGQ